MYRYPGRELLFDTLAGIYIQPYVYIQICKIGSTNINELSLGLVREMKTGTRNYCLVHTDITWKP